MKDLRKITSTTLQEVQRLAKGLRPSVLDDFGLEEAIARYGAEFGSTYGIEVGVAQNWQVRTVFLRPWRQRCINRSGGADECRKIFKGHHRVDSSAAKPFLDSTLLKIMVRGWTRKPLFGGCGRRAS